MKLNTPRNSRLGLASLLSLVVLLAGCETLEESKYEGIQVTPTYASRRLNGSVVLTASGGYAYRWSLEEPDNGSLSSTEGESVVYTVRVLPAAGFIQTIKVIGRLPNDAITAGSNSVQTAEARVSHVP